MTVELRRRQHLVSKGYQRNFAEGQFVAILDAHTGKIISSQRSIRENWRVDDFLSVTSQTGEVDDTLEREFSRRERVFLNVIRDIRLEKRITPTQKDALDALAATHAIRSLSFAVAHDKALRSVIEHRVPTIPQDVRAIEAFARDRGRPPDPGELEAIVAAAARDFLAEPALFASAVERLTEGVQQLLGKWTVQLVGSLEDLPGFVLPDHPVLHGKRREGLFGFREAGAVGDSTMIAVPISRRLIAFYSAQRLPDVRIRTKTGIRWINSLLLRGAQSEVACHPDDARETSRLIGQMDRYPPGKFDSISLR